MRLRFPVPTPAALLICSVTVSKSPEIVLRTLKVARDRNPI